MSRKAGLSIACAMLISVAGDLSAQRPAVRIDPVAVQRDIARNPDFDVASFWRDLGIPARLDSVYSKVGRNDINPNPNASFDRCLGVCAAEIARADLDGDAAEEVILKIYQEWGVCRFLFFRSSVDSAGNAEWRFLGHADHDYARHYMPVGRVEVLGGRRYFVMGAQGTSGTGIWLKYDRWYELGRTNIEEVLSLPAEAYGCFDARSLCRESGSTVVSGTNGPQGDQFVVSFTVRYWGDYFLLDGTRYDDLPLFERTQRAVYVRPKGSTGYVLDAQGSDINAREARTVYHPDALTCQDFLIFNASDLARIASSGATPARAWLRNYIGQCEPSRERTRLLGVLTK